MDQKEVESLRTILVAIGLFCLPLAACTTVSQRPVSDPFPDDAYQSKAVAINTDEMIMDMVGPTEADGADWKSFQLDTPTRVRVRFTTDPGQNDLSLHVYKGNGRAMGALGGRPGQEQVLVGRFERGTYFVEIRAAAEVAAAGYSLMVQTEP